MSLLLPAAAAVFLLFGSSSSKRSTAPASSRARSKKPGAKRELKPGDRVFDDSDLEAAAKNGAKLYESEWMNRASKRDVAKEIDKEVPDRAPAPKAPAPAAAPAAQKPPSVAPKTPAPIVRPKPPAAPKAPAAAPPVAPSQAADPLAGYDPDKARREARTLSAHLKRAGRANYDRRWLERWQRYAGLNPDRVYGGATRGALLYFGAADAPQPFFAPFETVTYKPPR